MNEIWLMTEKYSSELTERFSLYRGELLIEEERIGGYTAFSCRFQDAGRLADELVAYLANLLAEWIIEDVERKVLFRLLDQEAVLFFPEEKGEVLDHIEQLLRETTVRKEILVRQTEKYLREETDFIVEGLIAFRLQEYRLYLREVVEKGIESFIVKREYEEFITLLRYFVEMQEPRLDEVHVLLFQGKGFQILDRQGHLIKNEGTEELAIDFLAERMEENDFLISTLITLSPEKIIFHGHDETKVVEMVQSVFGQKVSVCSGCARCREWINQS